MSERQKVQKIGWSSKGKRQWTKFYIDGKEVTEFENRTGFKLIGF